MAMLFSRTVRNLPVDLTEFAKLSKLSPDLLFTEQTMDRLVQVILAEQDTRISNKVCFYRSLRWCCLYLRCLCCAQSTKLQVIDILRTIASIDRDYRCALRVVLQDCKSWFDDDVDPELRERTLKDGHGELLPERVRTFVNV
jgi:hypothetical protein